MARWSGEGRELCGSQKTGPGKEKMLLRMLHTNTYGGGQGRLGHCNGPFEKKMSLHNKGIG